MPHRVTRNTDSNYVPIELHKNGSLTFSFHGFRFKILYLYIEKNPPKIKILERNMFVDGYS